MCSDGIIGRGEDPGVGSAVHPHRNDRCDSGAQLLGGKGLQQPSVCTGSLGDERIGSPIQQQHDRTDAGSYSLQRPRDRHAPHRADLHVDYRQIGAFSDGHIFSVVGVSHAHDLVRAAQGGPNLVLHPWHIAHQQYLHSANCSDFAEPNRRDPSGSARLTVRNPDPSNIPAAMKRCTPILLGMIITYLVIAGAGWAMADSNDTHVEIIEIGGNLDRAAVNFVTNRIDAAAVSGASAAIIQLDSGATLSDTVHHLVARIADPPLPLVVWVGPQPAVAFGGAAHMLAAAPVKAAAPGVEIGYADPVVAGGTSRIGLGHPLDAYSDIVIRVDQPIEGLVDVVAPSISNLLVELHGRTVPVRGQTRTLDTVRQTADGSVAVPTLFHEPGAVVRLLRIATGTETAFFFLMIGLTVVVFEFYALGPGLGAAVAAVCLLIAGYGLTVLPLRGWAVSMALLGVWMLTADFQRGRSGPLTAGGAVAMMIGGLFFTDAAPQIRPAWWIVLVVVISVTTFYVVAMRTVARARFSTPTVGRDHLVGQGGTAITYFGPDGVVEIRGARWKATAHREARLGPGYPVVVTGVDGSVLEVEPEVESHPDRVDRNGPPAGPEG